jgi:hypothetical protein
MELSVIGKDMIQEEAWATVTGAAMPRNTYE